MTVAKAKNILSKNSDRKILSQKAELKQARKLTDEGKPLDIYQAKLLLQDREGAKKRMLKTRNHAKDFDAAKADLREYKAA